MPNNTKTKAKRMGIKSVLAHGKDEQGRTKLALTAFGKGNNAELAIQTDGRGSNLAKKYEDRNITAKSIVPKGIETEGTIAGKYNVTYLYNPAENLGEDYLQLKSTLEKEFFGLEFPNDNVRIQIIHQILDIQKLLGIYVNDIIYCINNLRDETDLGEESDIVGRAMSNTNVNVALLQMRPYFGFFGEAFHSVVDDKGREITLSDDVRKKIEKIIETEQQIRAPSTPRFKQENLRIEIDTLKKGFKNDNAFATAKKKYDRIIADDNNAKVLRILGAMRQITAHFKENVTLFKSDTELPKILKDKFSKADFSCVETHYKKTIERINSGFGENAATNIKFLTELLPAESKEQLTEEYYCFAILKEGKNFGVNMKCLRETMFKLFIPKLTDPETKKEYDSYRSKIYGLSDFLLFKHLRNTSQLEDWVAVLRETSNENDKEKLYDEFAQTAWKEVGDNLTRLLDNLRSYFERISKEIVKTKEPPLSSAFIAGVAKKTANFTSFAKLLAFLCNFWEGKEINELISAYIHKFENIQMFIDMLQKLEGTKPQFSENYALFNEVFNVEADGKMIETGAAEKIARDLRVLASIGRMKLDLESAKRQLYKAAIEMLGVPDDSQFISDEWLAENVLLDKDSPNYVKRKTDTNPFRNFIAKQVIQSRRFMYLVRHTKPRTVRAVMNNRAIVHYVLSRIADIQDVHVTESQIDRYYQNLPDAQRHKNVTKEQKIDALADYLYKYSFEKNVFLQKKGIVLKDTAPPEKKREIECLKALTGLYLTVAYIVVKNLIKTNARYYIAFAAFERDYALFEKEGRVSYQPVKDANGQAIKTKNGQDKIDANYSALTEYFLDNVPKQDRFQAKDEERVSAKVFWKAFRAFLKTDKGHYTRKWREILRLNLEKAKKISPHGGLLAGVRNEAAHLNVLTDLPKYVADFKPKGMTSYFQLYHYILQRRLNVAEAEQNGTPCWDWIKDAYISLAYNLARYKNLTIEALFDEDSKPGKERQKRIAAKEEATRNKQ